MPKAFPTAYGFGASENIGGRGGVSVAITNTNNSGTGSYREAMEANYPRIIIPRIGGLVALTSDVNITNPYFTYAGQCAPGGGLLIKDYNTEIKTHNGIVRHLRGMPGRDALGAGRPTNGLMVFGGNPMYNITADHCTALWSTDQCMDAYGNFYNVTFQWSLIAEAEQSGAGPSEPDRGYGSLIGDGGFGIYKTISVHHCIWANNLRRNPLINCFPAGPGPIYGAPALRCDFRNNLIYNWISNGYTTWQRQFPNQSTYNAWVAASGGNPAVQVNAVKNHWLRGPDSGTGEDGCMFIYSDVKLFASGNLGPRSPSTPVDGFAIGVNHLTRKWQGDTQTTLLYGSYDTTPFVQATAFTAPVIPEHDASELFALLTAEAGATLPAKDTVWQRIMNEILTNTGSVGDHNDFPTLATGAAPTASQPDLIPDAWKVSMGLDPDTDYTGVSAPSGYDWVEVWANDVAGDGIATEDLPNASVLATRRHREFGQQYIGQRSYHFVG